MSARMTVVATAERAEVPPEVRRRIALFLAAGLTGQITLDVKEGRVLAYRLTECGRVDRRRLDENGHKAQDSD